MKNKLLLLVLSLLLLFLALECLVRINNHIKGRGFFATPHNQLKKGLKSPLPFRTFGVQLYREIDGVRHIASRYGEVFPMKKTPGSIRIVAFGGSTTENRNAYKDQKIHYPLLLEQQLRKATGKHIEVINVAYSAYATPHSLIMLELDVLSWNPDLIIVSHNVNDLLAAYWPGFTPDYSNKYTHEFYSLPDYHKIYTLPNLLFQHSQLYWHLKYHLKKRSSHKDVEMSRRSYGHELPADLARVFERNLVSMITLAKKSGIRVLLASQPLLPTQVAFEHHMGRKGYNDRVIYPLHEEFLSHHQAMNAILKKTAQTQSCDFIDNATRFGQNVDDFIDFVHYTPAGVRRLANFYSDHLLTRSQWLHD